MFKIKMVFVAIMLLIGTCFSFKADEDIYSGNTWGSIYKLQNVSSVYYDSQKTFSIYTLEQDDEVYCYDKEITETIFCWYLFNTKKEPIAGWIYYRNLEKLNEQRN